MRILLDDAILVVVDVQERLFPHIAENQKLEKKINTLVRGMKELEAPVLTTEQYVKGLGNTIPSVVESLGDVKRTEKMAFSCCDDNAFTGMLIQHNRKHIILCGIEAHVCVLQTSMDLLEKGFQPVVVADAVSSRALEDKNTALERMKQEGVKIASVESILFELCRISGTDRFKAVSKLVK